MNRSELMQLVETELRRGAKSVRGTLTRHQLDKLVTKVLCARPEKLKEYAFMTGRNTAIDLNARKQAQKRRRKHEHEQAKVAKREAMDAYLADMDLIAAKQQWTPFIATLPQTNATTRQQQLEMVRLRVLEGLGDLALARVFPGTNRNRRDQWKRRGLKLILANKPPAELRRTLERSTLNS